MIYRDLDITEEVKNAVANGVPVVALESTLISHGLPYPENVEIANRMESEVREHGAIPATIAGIDGIIRVGNGEDELDRLGKDHEVRKLSTRDLGAAVVQGANGGTTVAATMRIAKKVGIVTFATGGIGGVHRSIGIGNALDVSADLIELSRTPVMVVCAGAKAILDIQATLEHLESLAVPVVGYCTEDFPAFYSSKSGYSVFVQANSLVEVARIAGQHWSFGIGSGVVVANPLPEEESISNELIESAVQEAIKKAEKRGIHGQDVTPYLLASVSDITHGASKAANLSLLTSNARLAAQVACAYAKIMN